MDRFKIQRFMSILSRYPRFQVDKDEEEGRGWCLQEVVGDLLDCKRCFLWSQIRLSSSRQVSPRQLKIRADFCWRITSVLMKFLDDFLMQAPSTSKAPLRFWNCANLTPGPFVPCIPPQIVHSFIGLCRILPKLCEVRFTSNSPIGRKLSFPRPQSCLVSGIAVSGSRSPPSGFLSATGSMVSGVTSTGDRRHNCYWNSDLMEICS